MPTVVRNLGVFLISFLLFSLVLSVPAWAQPAPVDFIRDVRPILATHCFQCHGPDAASRKANLRLDVADGLKRKTNSGRLVVVPGKPQESELFVRITSKQPDYRMPPPSAEQQLTEQDIEVLRRWIEQGAPWQEHWAYQTPVKPTVPQVGDRSWCRNPIDRFILARLEREGLSPSPEADKETLIRRVTFDLTGLPPTPAEVDAFLRDDRPDAYERLVDRLLASPRYGEHMARFWLDAARYGDTHGLHLDNYREMWPYRDWVIKAFNQNLPYDQFIIWQLAGDLLPNPTLDQLVATGFNRAHVTTNEGGSIVEEVYVRNVVDRVVTTATVFMGLTFDCARCHDHKYDPFTMKDFYSMFAFFNSLDGSPMDGNRKDPPPVIKVPTREQRRRMAALERQIEALEQKLREPWPAVDQAQREWEAAVLAELAKERAELALGDWYWVGPFGSVKRYLWSRKHGPEGKPIDLSQTFKTAAGELKWQHRPDWADGKVHTDLPGNEAANFLYRKIVAAEPRKVKVSLGSDDAIKVYLNGKLVFQKNVHRGVAPDQDTVELSLEKGDNHLLIKIINYGGGSGYYFKVLDQAASVPPELAEILKVPAEKRTDEQKARLRDHFRNKVCQLPELVEVRQQLAALRKARTDLDRQIATTLIFRERKQPKPAFILYRGEYDKPRDRVDRATPAILPPMKPDMPKNRLGFAMWLVDRDHPLTARVTVNRFWQQVFGVGLVKTAEDFGVQGELPSHPELLDWLAVDFQDHGWDVKRFMRLIVTSATYRQSSRITPELYRRDPENRLLARGPRFRLDAEMLRDQALAVSGLLCLKMGGPSVKPPQPDGLWFAVGYSGSNTVRFKKDSGHDKVHRRTVYTFIKRTAPPPQLSIFDAPSRESTCVRRERTNTPLQALALWNDPQYVECARGLAERALREAGATAEERVRFMYRLCTARWPDATRLAELIDLARDLHEIYAAHPDEARKLIAIGEYPPDPSFDPIELATWTMVANTILNLDEVVTKN